MPSQFTISGLLYDFQILSKSELYISFINSAALNGNIVSNSFRTNFNLCHIWPEILQFILIVCSRAMLDCFRPSQFLLFILYSTGSGLFSNKITIEACNAFQVGCGTSLLCDAFITTRSIRWRVHGQIYPCITSITLNVLREPTHSK